jgi:hypothetical protein
MKTEEDITIRQYCGDIRERLLACRSRTIAVALKEYLCKELQTHCVSSMINNVLQVHVDQLIDEIFSPDGKNKFLETL